MRNGGLNFIEQLSHTKRKNLIRLLEKAVEMERLEHLATQDSESMDVISDGCFFLTFLYVWDINTPPGNNKLK